MSKHWMTVVGLAALCAWPAGRGLSQSAGSGYQGGEKILVPSQGWPCGMATGIPVPERGALVLEATLKLDQIYDVGRTLFGPRRVSVIQGGTVTGEKVNGAVMPGGLDFELSFSNRAMEIEQVFVLKTSDGKFIYLRSAGTAADPSDVRMVPDFEAPNASGYAWLNTGKFAGRRTVDAAAKTMKISVYDIANVATAANVTNSIQVTKPAEVLDQPWDFRKAVAGEQRGEQLVTENVTLGTSQSVGATKQGGRNIIPITGGILSGKIHGKVLSGGADFQKLANPMTLDARYLWQTDEGDVIIVRNGGPINSLAPRFEVRVDSKYAWLNQGNYLSSGPKMGAGGVGLDFYESKQ